MVLDTSEAVAVSGTAPDAPTLADECGGVEWNGTVDWDNLRLADDELGAVAEKRSEPDAELFSGQADNALNNVAIKLVPIGIRREPGLHFQGLTTSYFFHGCLLTDCAGPLPHYAELWLDALQLFTTERNSQKLLCSAVKLTSRYLKY